MKMSSKVMHKFEHKLGKKLHEVEAENDLGMIIDKQLNFEDHLVEKVNKANNQINKLVGTITTFVALDQWFLNLFIVTQFNKPH